MALSTSTASLAAGVLSGVVTLLAFLVIHHFWIKPIWMITLPGLLIAAMGGLAIGWAYLHLAPGLPPRPWTSLAMLGIILAVLTPGALLSLTHGPLFDLATATIPPGRGFAVVTHFVLELVLTAMLTGALLGWWIGRSPTAAAATALAGLAFAIGPGHNVPMFGMHPLAFKGFALVGMIAVVAAVVLVEAAAWFARR